MLVNVLHLLVLCAGTVVLGEQQLLFHDLSSETTSNVTKHAQPIFICTSEPDKEITKKEKSGLATRSFLLNRRRRWPHGIVPYQIDPAFTAQQVAKIQQSIKMFSDVSCVKWVPRRRQKDYVQFVHYPMRETCNSVVGRKGGQQDVNLGDECFNDNGFQGAIPHEMMHALGFIHEQQRLDRDCYVNVLKEAAEKKRFDFGITPDTDTGFPYDFESIMHYGETANLSPKNGERLGNYEGQFTKLDKMKLNNMYCGGPTFCEQEPVPCKQFLAVQETCRLSFSNFFR